MTTTMTTAVFGYGSLVDHRSASVTLGRELASEEILPARARGWWRRFSQARDNRACEKTFALADTGEIPDWILGMNVERAPAGEPPVNGALIVVSEAELERLDIRERRYDRADVTATIEAAGAATAATVEGLERIVTYVAKPTHFAPEPPPGAVILRSYAEAIEAAFAGLGREQLDEYRRTTHPYPAELVDGLLVRAAIPEGNPRDW